MGETVADVSELALFNVLLDGVESLLLGDLHLGVGPSGNLDDHYRLRVKRLNDVLGKINERDVLLRIVLDSSAKRGMSLVTPESTRWTWLAHRKEGKGGKERTGRGRRSCLPARCRHGALLERMSV